MTFHAGDGERTLIIRHRDKDAFHWTCYELPQLKEISAFPEPANWNWENHALGTKYASSLHAGQLVTIDLSTGQPIKTVAVSMPGYIQNLFDKALIVESGLVFALPSLQPVANHPLVNTSYNPFASELHFNLPREQRPTWRLDFNRWFLDGFVYGKDLKPEPLYLGQYSYRMVSGEHRGLALEVTLQGESTNLKIQLEEGTLAEASSGKSKLTRSIKRFNRLGTGWLGSNGDDLVFLEAKPESVLPKAWTDLKSFPIMLPPLLTFGGEFQPVQWIGGNATDCEIGNVYGLESKIEGEKFMVRLPGPAKHFMQQSPLARDLVRKLEMESGVGYEAPWDQVVAGYKARNMRWLAPYAAAMKVRFSGIPIELPCPLTFNKQTDHAATTWCSVILDMPPEVLESYRIKNLPPTKLQTANASSDRGQLQRLATSLQSQRETIEAPPKPEPVTLAPLPAKFDTSTVQGKFSWVLPAHATRLKLMPIRLLLSTLTTLFAVWIINGIFASKPQGASPGNSVQFVGNKWWVAIPMVVACDSFDSGLVFLVDWLTARPEAEFDIYDLMLMLLMFSIYLPFTLFVYFKSLQGDWARKLAVYVTATLCYLVIWFTIIGLLISILIALK